MEERDSLNILYILSSISACHTCGVVVFKNNIHYPYYQNWKNLLNIERRMLWVWGEISVIISEEEMKNF
jgi:hypothetical protein